MSRTKASEHVELHIEIIQQLPLAWKKSLIHEWLRSDQSIGSMLLNYKKKLLKRAIPKIVSEDNIVLPINEVSEERAKWIIEAAVEYGGCEVSALFQEIYERDCNKTVILIEVICLHAIEEEKYYQGILASIAENKQQKSAVCFSSIIDFAKTLCRSGVKTSGLKVVLRRTNKYEFLVRSYGNQNEWNMIERAFSSSNCVVRNQDKNNARWQLESTVQERFCEELKTIANRAKLC